MLKIGNGALTLAESRTHFAIWALMKSLLIIGTDLATLLTQNVQLLQNNYLLAFYQDSTFRAPAMSYIWGTNPTWTLKTTNPADSWAGQSQQRHVVALFNSPEQERNMEVKLG